MNIKYDKVLILILSSGLCSRFYKAEPRFLKNHKLLAPISNSQKIIDYIIQETNKIANHVYLNSFIIKSLIDDLESYYRSERNQSLLNYVNKRILNVKDNPKFKGSAAGLYNEDVLKIIEKNDIEHIVIISGDQPFAFEEKYLLMFIQEHMAVYGNTRKIGSTILISSENKPENIGVALYNKKNNHLIGFIEKHEMIKINENTTYVRSGMSKSGEYRLVNIKKVLKDCEYLDINSVQTYCGGVMAITKEAYLYCDINTFETLPNNEKDVFSGTVGQIVSANYDINCVSKYKNWITLGANTQEELDKLIWLYEIRKKFI